MRPYAAAALFSVGSVALAFALFFGGFFFRGWVDQQRGGGPPPVAGPVGAAASQTAPEAPVVAPAASAPLVGEVRTDGAPARGPQDAAVTIVEFSDFQCPFCKRHFDETLPLVKATYGERVRYVFRDFPIGNLHPQAPKAAEAGRCAFEQGRFWEYHDRLFQNQGALDVPSLKQHARALGLDGAAFDACLDGGRFAAQVQQSFDAGRSYGVTGTPTFFVNGRKLVGAQPFAVLQQVIDEELRKAGAR